MEKSNAAVPRSPIPFVLLTGFLGAGKTTVLNRILASQHRRRVAVLVNELGRIDIDGRLLKARSGDVIELVGGCVCHEVKTMEQLWQAVDEILLRTVPDVIVLETTGIAEPEAIVEGMAEQDRRDVFVAGVVTAVDAEAGLAILDRHPEARAQVLAADALLLTKLDLAAAPVLESLHRRLADLNPKAERAAFPEGEAGTAALSAWLLDRRRIRKRTEDDDHDHRGHAHAHSQLISVALTEARPLLRGPLLALLEGLGHALIRAKGFVQLDGELRCALVEKAGLRLDFRFLPQWPAGMAPRTELVLIGEGLDGAALERQLWACCVR